MTRLSFHDLVMALRDACRAIEITSGIIDRAMPRGWKAAWGVSELETRVRAAIRMIDGTIPSAFPSDVPRFVRIQCPCCKVDTDAIMLDDCITHSRNKPTLKCMCCETEFAVSFIDVEEDDSQCATQ